MLQLPPLSLYVHIPWCVQKCPYCDFNSHALKETIPEQAYISALLDDLRQDQHLVQGRHLHSIFIGGGTPSLLSPEAIGRLLAGIREQLPFAPEIEITLEANPGTVEAGRFAGFMQAGVNRISIGIQSFQADKLRRLGRIHDPEQARFAAREAKAVGLPTFNLDLMHGLPEQTLADGLHDLQQAIDLAPPHLSWYQLTIEPNTPFASRPPALPEDETLADIYDQGHALLLANGYRQYEVSAYAKPGHQARHNLNYWRFGDYLGIGCGAHGKISLPAQGKLVRTVKVKHPKGYLDAERPYLDQYWPIKAEDLPLEYFMNRLRLFEPMPKTEFQQLTGLSPAILAEPLQEALRLELLLDQGDSWQVSPLGRRFLNRLLDLFMAE
ncbi:radical SAM family heme chaperone HemW [Zobellella maritima]|uniref:radical SAM family heme chaperone HemW n=1 Tax=Zobellella maritima TaxID=2059725 RepID=UPI000E306C18|nr:radical SAM family heme chaperone HemW [Zobellella maritima]